MNDDIVTNVLSFLPARSIIKMELLARRFCFLTSEEFFVMLQACHADAADSGFFAVHKYAANIYFVDQRAVIPDDAFEFLRSTAGILSSANGLIFYFDRTLKVSDGIGVYNPVRGTSVTVPWPPDTEEFSCDFFVGVGAVVSKKTLGYKIVYVKPWLEWGSNMHCKIYDSRDGEWKVDCTLVGVGKRNLRLEVPVVCGSIVFWASDCGAYMVGVDPYVLAVDVDAAAAAQRSRIVPLPAEAVAAGSPDEYDIRIARWHQSELLCLIQYRKMTSVFALWLFKTNDEDTAPPGTWKKIVEVAFDTIAGHKLQVGSFTLINRDTLIFITPCCPLYCYSQLYSYSLSSRQMNNLGRINSPHWTLIPYTNTLRPPAAIF